MAQQEVHKTKTDGKSKGNSRGQQVSNGIMRYALVRP